MSYRVQTLKALALMGASRGFVTVSTRDLGREMNISQQTASYRLGMLAKAGLIQRRRGRGHGQQVALTDAGVKLLRQEYADYQRIFEPMPVLEISGRVASGLGEGGYYLGQKRYREQIMDVLGFEPYTGTLNLELDPENARKVDQIPRGCFTRLQGFSSGGRTFGQVDCMPATIDSTECGIIMPARTHHRDVLEVIAPVRLRDALGLEDGSRVTVTLHLD